MSPRFVRVAAGLALLGAAGCLRWFREENTGPTDANLAAILLAANYTDISYAQIADSFHTKNREILNFASRMLTDHSAVNKGATDLFANIGLTPEDNVTSLDFRDESSAKRDILRDLNGRKFDSTYIENEVSYHTKLLTALDSVLIPKAVRPELKQLLSNVRPAVAAHLEHAQRVKASVIR